MFKVSACCIHTAAFWALKSLRVWKERWIYIRQRLIYKGHMLLHTELRSLLCFPNAACSTDCCCSPMKQSQARKSLIREHIDTCVYTNICVSNLLGTVKTYYQVECPLTRKWTNKPSNWACSQTQWCKQIGKWTIVMGSNKEEFNSFFFKKKNVRFRRVYMAWSIFVKYEDN